MVQQENKKKNILLTLKIINILLILKIINDTLKKNKKRIPDIVLYYSLFLPAYQPNKNIPTSNSFKYIIESNQSQTSGKGHYNAMSVRTLCKKDGSSIINSYIMFKGFRTPGDTDSKELDDFNNPIIRSLKRMYFEEYEITIIDENGKNIGGIGGQLQYQDEGVGTATSVPELTFPINQAYGIYSKYQHGNINWKYDNTGIYLRTLTISPPN